MSSIPISVLMTAYNAEKYIQDSIESIRKQTYKNFEFLILDDGSYDNTYKIAKSYEKKDKRIKVYKNNRNKNIAPSRNLLLKKSKGEFIAWADADDISTPDRLKLEFEYLKKHPEVGIVGGYLRIFNEKGKLSLRKFAEDDTSLRKLIFRYSPVAQPSAMIRREVFHYIGLYNKNLSPAEDIDMSFRIGTKYAFANLQQVVLKYRDYTKSQTYIHLKKIELLTIKTRLKYIFHPRYTFYLLDLFYNIAQMVTILIMPAKIRIILFNKFRNTDIIS